MLRQMPTMWELARRSEEHDEGHGAARHDVRGDGLQLHRADRRPRHQGAGDDPAQHAQSARARSSCTSSRARARATRPPKPDPIKWHGPGPFDPASGTIFKEKATGPTYSQVFGQWLCDMAAARSAHRRHHARRCAKARAWSSISKKFPQRYFDVAIAEQHAVTFAAGLACEGLKPVVAIYSTFLQRAYDQLIHDVALQNLPVVFALDRAGLVGGDGATHQGSYDYSFLRCIPNLVVMAPADENECRQMLYTATTLAGPRRCAIRAARVRASRRSPK